MSVRIHCFILALTLSGTAAVCQSLNEKIWRHWYMGQQAAVRFEPGIDPVPLFDSPNTNSGSTPVTVSDPVTGDLLFYSTQNGLYTAAHQLMPGSPVSDPTTVRMACIPHPGLQHLFYVFKRTYSAAAFHVQYLVVNTQLNGGLGDVVPPGYQSLATGLASTFVAASSPVDGTHHLYLHELGTNVFLKYAINATSGLDPEPVPIAVGSAITHTTGQSDPPAASPDGLLLAVPNGFTWTTTFFQIDPVDGMLFDPIDIWTGPLRGAAFSPNSRYFYCTRTAYQYEPQFFGYDLASLDAESILDSEFGLDPNNTPGANWFQLRSAADGEIYFLSAIVSQPIFATTLGRITNADLGPDGAVREIGVVDLERAHSGQAPWTFWLYDVANSVSESGPVLVPIHPNPADDHFVVNAPTGTRILIVDAMGRTVGVHTVNGGTTMQRIPVGSLPSGSYRVLFQHHGQFTQPAQRLMVIH